MFHGAECEWTAPRRLRPVHRTLSDVQAFYPQGTQKDPNLIAARHGVDRVAAFVHDLRHIAASMLREPCEEFSTIMRRGYRSWTFV